MQRDGSSPWLYVFATPIAVVNVVALLNDPRRMGQPTTVDDAPVVVLFAMGLAMLALVCGTWAHSRFRYRTPVALVQVALTVGVGVSYALDIKTSISIWDLVQDVVWLVTVGLQVFGTGREDDPQAA
jgi:hypothetical protein